MSWDTLPKENLQYFLQKLKDKFDGKADNSDVTEVDTSNTTPLLYRQTPYNADGVFLDELVGGSVAWNQLVQNGNFADVSGWTWYGGTFSVSNNKGTVNWTDSNTTIDFYRSAAYVEGHKYLVSYEYESVTNITAVGFVSNSNIGLISNTVSGTSGKLVCIVAAQASGSKLFQIRLFRTNASTQSSIILKNVMLIDLTQMFGTTIADYIYSLEQATAGSGIAWLKSHGFFTKDYYPYNTGELISVKTSGKKYVGKNLVEEILDGCNINSNGVIISEQYEFSMCIANVIKGMTYIITTDDPNGFVGDFFYEKPVVDSVSYDSTRIVVNNRIFTAPISGYVAFRTRNGYATPQCEIGSQATDYEPYTERTYDISNIDLRGIPKLVNNELVYDGDTYESNGDVTRKYWIVDLGSLDWTYDSTYNRFLSGNVSDMKDVETRTAQSICYKYVCLWHDETIDTNWNKVFYTGNKKVIVHDHDYTDAATFKTAMSGVYLIYELATPTTETTDPYTNPQICDKDGTEEFIDNRTVPVPVGHNSRYADLPAIMDGDYLSYMARNFASEEYVDRALEEVDTELDTKVDKVSGKGLSTNDYTNEEKALVATIPDKADSADVEGTKTVSGNPITLTDASETYAESLVVELEPKQDLHGYDFPWVGGAGKNKVDYLSCIGIGARDGTDSVYASGTTSISGDNLSINYGYGNNGGILKGIKGIPLNSGDYVTISFDVVSLTGSSVFAVGIGDYNGGGTNNVKDNISPSNNKVSVTLDAKSNYSKLGVFIQPTNANSSAVIKNVQVELGQTATPFAHYSNICPISGYEGVEVDDVGINRLENNVEDGSTSDYSVTVNADGTLNVTGSSASVKIIIGNFATGFYGSSTDQRDYKKHLPNGSYKILNSGVTGLNVQIVGYNDDGVITTIAIGTNFTIDDTYKYNHVRLYASAGSYTNAKVYPMIYSADISNPDYEPYHSSNATIQFGQTVMGGKVNVTDGGTDDDRNEVVFDGSSDENWGVLRGENNYCIIYANVPNVKNNQTIMANWLKGIPTVHYSQLRDGEIAFSTGGDPAYFNARFDNDFISDVNDLRTWLASNNLQICYEKATPTTISTPPTDLKLLKGTNNLTTNGTTINLGYQPDNVIGDVLQASEEYTDQQIAAFKFGWKVNYRIENGASLPSNVDYTKYSDVLFELMNQSMSISYGSALYPVSNITEGRIMYVNGDNGTYRAVISNDGSVTLTNAYYLQMNLR